MLFNHIIPFDCDHLSDSVFDDLDSLGEYWSNRMSLSRDCSNVFFFFFNDYMGLLVLGRKTTEIK